MPEPGAALSHRDVFVEGLGQAEVGHFDDAFARHQDVVRLDVAVDHVLIVRVLECIGADQNHVQRVPHAELLEIVHPVLHAAPIDELDGGEVDAAHAVGRVNLHDVGMLQAGHRAGFAQEPLDEVGLFGELGRKSLERDLAIEAGLRRQEDSAHAPLAELLFELEVAKLRDFLALFGIAVGARRLGRRRGCGSCACRGEPTPAWLPYRPERLAGRPARTCLPRLALTRELSSPRALG